MKISALLRQWEVFPEEDDKPYIRIRGTCPGGRYKVANVPKPSDEGHDGWALHEARADAHLIAAAPDMLDALEGLLNALPSATTHPAIAQARRALAKARGEV